MIIDNQNSSKQGSVGQVLTFGSGSVFGALQALRLSFGICFHH